MKNILIAAMFFFGQLQFTFARSVHASSQEPAVAKYKSANFQIENLKFSDLILTKDELATLSVKDQATYQMAMISLGMILELKQQDVMGYETKTQKTKTSYNQFLRWGFLVPQAHAILPALGFGAFLIDGALWAGGAALVRTAIVRGSTYLAERAAPKIAQRASESLARVGTMAAGKPAQEMAKEAVVANLANYNAARKALDLAVKSGKKSPAELEALAGAARAAQSQAKQANSAFIKSYGSDITSGTKELGKVLKGSVLHRLTDATKKYAPDIVAGGVMMVGVDTLTKEKLGQSAQEIAAEAGGNGMRALAEFLGLGDLAGPSLADLRKGDSSQAAGKACLFGGHASQWKDFAGSGIKCTRPDSSKSESCSGDNKFLCSSHGIQLEAGGIESELCIDKGDLNNLTIRCSKTLLEVIEKKKTAIEPDKRQAFLDNLKKQLVGIEKHAGMKDEDGKAKSVLAYCVAENVTQKPECQSIMEIIATLKGTQVPQVLATRPPEAPAAAASAAAGDGAAPPPPPPAASSPSGGAADGPTRQ